MKLNKEEMKSILGGQIQQQLTCTWTWAAGYQQHSPQTTPCTGDESGCQAQADAICWAFDACLDVDCR